MRSQARRGIESLSREGKKRGRANINRLLYTSNPKLGANRAVADELTESKLSRDLVGIPFQVNERQVTGLGD